MWSALPAAAENDTRIIALVVTETKDAAFADAAETALSGLQAEVLRVETPTNAQLRGIMRRFASEAEKADAALVFLGMPSVQFDGRHFVLPGDAQLERASDVFTQAIPLRALARVTHLAERGGAVFVASQTTTKTLPAGVASSKISPGAVSGSSEFIFVESAQSGPALNVVQGHFADDQSVNLQAVFTDVALVEGVTISAVPPSRIMLRAPIAAQSVQVAPALSGPVNSEADLVALEASLSPGVKRSLQRVLRELGHYSGLIDGIMGGQTRQAITAYQAGQGETETGFLSLSQLRRLLEQG